MIDAIKLDGLGPYFVRDPRSKLPVSVDWSAWLAREATTISSSTWTAEAGLTTSAPTQLAGVAQVFVEGGVAGSSYVLRNTITCANGAIESRSIRVVTRDR